jgi:hypothetical protein
MPSPQPLTTSCAETSDVANAVKVGVAHFYTGRADHLRRFHGEIYTMIQQAGVDLLAVRHRGPKETKGGEQEEALMTRAVPGTGVEVGEIREGVRVRARRRRRREK